MDVDKFHYFQEDLDLHGLASYPTPKNLLGPWHVILQHVSSLIYKRTWLPIIFFICTRLSVFTQWSRYTPLAPRVQKIFPAHIIYFSQVLFEGQTVHAVLSMRERNRSTIYFSFFHLFFSFPNTTLQAPHAEHRKPCLIISCLSFQKTSKLTQHLELRLFSVILRLLPVFSIQDTVRIFCCYSLVSIKM